MTYAEMTYAEKHQDEKALAAMSRGRNKYGEIVKFHGPVCSHCHQRISEIAAILTNFGPTPVICKHCRK